MESQDHFFFSCRLRRLGSVVINTGFDQLTILCLRSCSAGSSVFELLRATVSNTLTASSIDTDSYTRIIFDAASDSHEIFRRDALRGRRWGQFGIGFSDRDVAGLGATTTRATTAALADGLRVLSRAFKLAATLVNIRIGKRYSATFLTGGRDDSLERQLFENVAEPQGGWQVRWTFLRF
jgi:hypothetical protein